MTRSEHERRLLYWETRCESYRLIGREIWFLSVNPQTKHHNWALREYRQNVLFMAVCEVAGLQVLSSPQASKADLAGIRELIEQLDGE